MSEGAFQGFTVGTWKGLPQWRCNRCRWDTLASEEEMRAHIRERHAPRVRRVHTGLVDAKGQPIVSVRSEPLANGLGWDNPGTAVEPDLPGGAQDTLVTRTEAPTSVMGAPARRTGKGNSAELSTEVRDG